ncbi:MAG: hypothetical protein LUI07_03815, partial [Lachnospiraceae bacterium]|nr:hypothetical protein [Lachnospiraceae bacterium]
GAHILGTFCAAFILPKTGFQPFGCGFDLLPLLFSVVLFFLCHFWFLLLWHNLRCAASRDTGVPRLAWN